MAFNVKAQVGDPIPTAKDNETIRVQVVEITTRQGKVMNRVEARVFVDNAADGGYVGPTKVALVLDDVSNIDRLIDALETAKEEAGLGTVTPAAPVKVVKARQRRANAPRAKAAAAV